MSLTKYPIEAIDWVDSVGTNGWQSPDDIERAHDDMAKKSITSIGQVLRDDEVAVTLCLSQGGVTGQLGDCMTIPKVSIRHRRVIDAGSDHGEADA